MEREVLSDAISGLDQRFISEAEHFQKRRILGKAFHVLAIAAAVLLLTVTGGFIFNRAFMIMLIRNEDGLRLSVTYYGPAALDDNEDGLVILKIPRKLAASSTKTRRAQEELTQYDIDLSLKKEASWRDEVWKVLTDGRQVGEEETIVLEKDEAEIVRPYVPENAVIAEAGISAQMCCIQYTTTPEDEDRAVMYITSYMRDGEVIKYAHAFKGDIVYKVSNTSDEVETTSVKDISSETYFY